MSSLDPVIINMLGIDGAIGAAIVDNNSGMALATGGGAYDMDIVSGSAIEIIRAFLATSHNAGADEVGLDHIAGVYDHYILLIRLLAEHNAGLSMVLVLERERSNQAMAVYKMNQFAAAIRV